MPDARSIETTQPFRLTAPSPARTRSRRGRRLERLHVFFKSRRLFNALLIAIVLALYTASINFGLIWDDPKWYQQGAGQSLGQLFTSLDTYQFYRPLAIGLNRLLVSPTGVVNAPLAHLIQVAAHLIATLAVVPLLRAFKIDDRAARISAILFAIYPLSYQAVAWQAPQQPIATLAVFVSILAADRFLHLNRVRYLIASVVTYAFALLFQESALPFVWVFGWLAASHWTRTKGSRSFWPLIHLALAVLYFSIWLNVPRQAGVTGRGLDARVLAYVVQSIAFPMASAGSSVLINWPVATLTLVFAAIAVLLLLGAWRARGWRAALFSGAWIAAGVLPIVVGLSWSYVRIGSRLLYPASLGIALVWGSCIAGLWTGRLWQRVLSIGLAAIVIAISIGQWNQLQRLYLMGTQHLDQTIITLEKSSDQNLLFINYPDRIELLPPPYPLGNWGLILTPVVQDLSDYAVAKVGYSARTTSLSAFRAGTDQRGAWQYAVAMRGEDTPAEKLYEVAAQADRVLITDYLPDGQLRLREVGSIRSSNAATSFIASFEGAAELIAVTTDSSINLTWRSLKPLSADTTIFLHLWKDGAFVSAFDGDSLGGLIPPAIWQPGDEIIDVRRVDSNTLPAGRYEVRVGLYRRGDGVRYPAFDANGQRLPDDAVTIGTFDAP